MLLAFGVVAELFNGVRDSPAEPMDGAVPPSAPPPTGGGCINFKL